MLTFSEHYIGIEKSEMAHLLMIASIEHQTFVSNNIRTTVYFSFSNLADIRFCLIGRNLKTTLMPTLIKLYFELII